MQTQWTAYPSSARTCLSLFRARSNSGRDVSGAIDHMSYRDQPPLCFAPCTDATNFAMSLDSGVVTVTIMQMVDVFVDREQTR